MSSKIDPEPQDAKGYFERGRAYLIKKEWDNAIADFDKSIVLNPQDANAYINRGFAYGNKGEWDTAIADFSKAIELDPEYTKAYLYRGAAYFKKEEWDKAIGDFDKAIAGFDKATEPYPQQYAEAYLARGLAYAGKKEWDKAIADSSKTIEEFSKATEPDPQKCAKAYFNRGAAYSGKKEWDKAIADFSKAIELNPQYAQAYLARGANYIVVKKEYDKAIADFNKAIEEFSKAIEPDPQQYAEVYYYRGLAYGRKEEWDSAIADYDKAIDLNPQHADAYFSRGAAYGAKEEWGKAIENFDTAIDINHEYDHAHFALGLVYLEKKEWRKAIKNLMRTAEINPASKYGVPEVYVALMINDIAGNSIDDEVIENYFTLFTTIKNIQYKLFYKLDNPDVTHYTSLNTLKNLISKEGGEKCFRFYNSAYMNDPEEGRVFFETMEKSTDLKYNLEEHFYGASSNMLHYSPAYIGSFIPVGPKRLKDKLPLWRTYGKQNGEEAAGSCLTFPRNRFEESNPFQIGRVMKKDSEGGQDSRPCIYQIVYVDVGIPDQQDLRKELDKPKLNSIDESDKQELSDYFDKMAECLNKIGDFIEGIPDNANARYKSEQLVRELLDSVRFLFKASYHEEEREVRVLQLAYSEGNTERKSDKIKVDAEQTPPRFYLEASESFRFSEVIFGPRAQNFKNWEWWIKKHSPKTKVKKSDIKYGS